MVKITASLVSKEYSADEMPAVHETSSVASSQPQAACALKITLVYDELSKTRHRAVRRRLESFHSLGQNLPQFFHGGT